MESKRVNITGPTPESVAKAKQEIDMLVADDGAEHTESVECPQGIVGRCCSAVLCPACHDGESISLPVNG